MSGTLERKWIEKYMESLNLLGRTAKVFTGFNVNIDVAHGEKFELDKPPEIGDRVENIEELKAALRYCKENGENHEVDYSELEIGRGKKRQIGGQGGIMSNYLAETGNEVILYTSLLSEELSEIMSEKILYPVEDDNILYLKNIQNAVNSNQTKINHIFEFEGEKSGRLILSGRLKGYEPYLPHDLEEDLPLIQGNIDCCIFSGFHNVTGNKEVRLKKSAEQLGEMHRPIHVEYVHKDRETANMILNYIVPEADSLGLDETELREIAGTLELDPPESPNFGEAFNLLRKIREKFELSRIHLHTHRYHITLTESHYPVKPERIRESMLFGELSAIQLAEKGEIPDSGDLQDFSVKGKNIQGVQELENFGNFHDMKGFAEEGIAELEDVTVVGIPVIIHQDPERTVGMGDLISSGSFSMEQTGNN
ncbi:MAG: hypothetical protein BRC28_01820 [Nanohaloarchaea archaeon SW_4_43_9]|nr:MAG: hypothetical protein BRC28_01820 [Nanohaloarchaea archaeon SW_4_43_9]